MALAHIIPGFHMVGLPGGFWVSQVTFRKLLCDFGVVEEEWKCIMHAEFLMRQRQLGFLPAYIGALAPNAHRFLGFQLPALPFASILLCNRARNPGAYVWAVNSESVFSTSFLFLNLFTLFPDFPYAEKKKK